MNWLTSFSFLVILFITHHDYAESRKAGSGAVSKSPWADANKAKAFMQCLIQNIARSPVFPQQEKEDMESIVETMMSAISSMSSSQKGSSHAQLQAMNMAFASSMAELVIAEDAGDMQAIALKTDALSQTLKTCFRSTMGTVNRQFIAEIKDLIKVFAQEAAAGAEDNAGDDGDFYASEDQTATGMTQSNYNLNLNLIDTQQTQANQYYTQDNANQGFPTYGAPSSAGYGAPGGAAGPSGDLSGLTNNLAQSLATSSTFQAIFRAGVSSQVAVRIATSAVQSTLSSSLRVDSGTSGKITNNLQSAMLNLGSGADVRSYAMAVSSTLVSGLSSGGLLNSQNAADIGVNIVSGFLQNAAGVAAQFGIRISSNDVSSDIRTVTNTLRSSITSQTTTSVSTSISSVGGTSFDVGAPAGLGAPGGLGSPDFGAGPASPGYGGPGGAAGPSGDLSGLTNNLAQSLATSSTFQAIFRAGVSSQVAVRIATSAVQSTLSSSLRVDSGTSGKITNNLQSAMLNLGSGADVRSYAMAVSSTLVSGLSSGGLLNSQNAADIGVNIVSGFLQNAAGVAAQFGIRISSNDVSSDIRTVTNTLRSSITSQTTTSVSTSISSVGGTSLDVGSQAGLNVGIGGMSDARPLGSSPGSPLGSLLSSPSGLLSPRAASRIQALTNGVLNSIRPNGLDFASLSSSLASASSDARNSGLSGNDAKLEVLLEVMVALIQVLSSSQVGSVNMASTSNISNSLAASLRTVLN